MKNFQATLMRCAALARPWHRSPERLYRRRGSRGSPSGSVELFPVTTDRSGCPIRGIAVRNRPRYRRQGCGGRCRGSGHGGDHFSTKKRRPRRDRISIRAPLRQTWPAR